MQAKLIRYRTHPEQGDENQSRIEAVFAELERVKPKGVRYLVVRCADATFQHLVAFDPGVESSVLTRLEAFQAFQAGVRERCPESPEAGAVTIVGSYGMGSP